MRLRVKTWLAVGASLVLMSAAAGCEAAHRGAAVNPQAVALRLSDLRSQSKPGPAHYLTAGQVASAFGGAAWGYVRHGMLRAYEDGFDRNVISGSTQSWLLHAVCTVSVYRGAAGARWGYTRLRAAIARSRRAGSTTSGTDVGQALVNLPYRHIRVPQVGDQDAGFTTSWSGDEFGYMEVALVFRRADAVVLLRVIGLDGEVPTWKVVRVARRIAGRVHGNGHGE